MAVPQRSCSRRGVHVIHALIIAILLSTMDPFAGQVLAKRKFRALTRANFDLAAEWTVKRQFAITSDIWTIPSWAEGDDIFAYRHAEDEDYHYYLVDIRKRSKRELFDGDRICSLLESYNDTTLCPDRLVLGAIRIDVSARAGDAGGRLKTVTFDFKGSEYRYDIDDDSLKKIERETVAGGEEAAGGNRAGDILIPSPDRKSSLLIRDNDLFLLRGGSHETPAGGAAGCDTTRIIDGEEDYGVYPENIHWSPDSRYVALLVEDWRELEDLWLVDHYGDPRPTLRTFKWPMPGEKVEQYELRVYDTEEMRLREIETERFPDQTLLHLRWSPDSRSIYFCRMSRDWKSLDLCRTYPDGDVCDVLVAERGKRQVITRAPFEVLGTTGEIVWQSWKDGWNHYYMVDPGTGDESAITSGDFNVGRIIRIDEESRTLFFMGNAREEGRNPYYHHLYSVGFDGKGLALLTPEDAEHEIYFSHSGDHFVDNYSRADLPPRAVVRKSSGELVMELEDADISGLEKNGWKRPEIFRAKAADGTTDLWGVMFKPFDFDPSRKYPVITYGYPGKETEFLPWRFHHNAWVTGISTSLAQYGFIVVVAGNRGGSPERSYEYYNYGENDFRGYPVADKKAVIEQLAAKHQFIDGDRVGIMGQSSGGFMAASAILLEPDFFKVAVAKCGPQDPSLYYHHWYERYAEWSVPEPGSAAGGARGQSNDEIASNLNGRLLLVQGDMDLHVPPSLTYRLAYALMMADRRFDIFVIPKADHFWGDNYPYVIKYIELYFVENLLGDRSFGVDMSGSRPPSK